ncbi:hypothetical protein M0R04_09065 [Candidatus Dojkabacteria bacterium]|jgi:hypothetical protein|nr:hypothetical protein [Candidatus Dojkabacteria bacterium]
MEKIKQIYCIHFRKENETDGGYSYDLIGAELNLCIKCETKLAKQIILQAKEEKSVNKMMIKRGWKAAKKWTKIIDEKFSPVVDKERIEPYKNKSYKKLKPLWRA